MLATYATAVSVGNPLTDQRDSHYPLRSTIFIVVDHQQFIQTSLLSGWLAERMVLLPQQPLRRNTVVGKGMVKTSVRLTRIIKQRVTSVSYQSVPIHRKLSLAFPTQRWQSSSRRCDTPCFVVFYNTRSGIRGGHGKRRLFYESCSYYWVWRRQAAILNVNDRTKSRAGHALTNADRWLHSLSKSRALWCAFPPRHVRC